ncbi:STAS domain-containing protein [candidate division KSB1 bacterium]|nr:STAS domain-containing protein [candidate division KSB1 bacterium]
MVVRKRGDQATIILNSDCTIVDAESDADTLRSLSGNFKKYTVDAGDVAEIDTAYLQILLSLKATAEHNNVTLDFVKMSDAFRETLAVYGINLSA